MLGDSKRIKCKGKYPLSSPSCTDTFSSNINPKRGGCIFIARRSSYYEVYGGTRRMYAPICLMAQVLASINPREVPLYGPSS